MRLGMPKLSPSPACRRRWPTGRMRVSDERNRNVGIKPFKKEHPHPPFGHPLPQAGKGEKLLASPPWLLVAEAE
jgi:hypothetical protein